MFTQQRTISSVIISTTAPFQTVGSDLVGAICEKIRTTTANMMRKSYFLQKQIWKFTTFTNPEVVKARRVVLGRSSAIR
ncbi:hypothetical protein AZE42_11183 [Rhizopogon vesiculosus]|uniref:Uncharacterized protein n=1 Tax=Rhizopogon vesiculosus TaxID=180088 RepID=A0A1J8PXS9_9AGAM|nr:hypothetical protein AZE42_11183 [Rhizopogon vesiculosus]